MIEKSRRNCDVTEGFVQRVVGALEHELRSRSSDVYALEATVDYVFNLDLQYLQSAAQSSEQGAALPPPWVPREFVTMITDNTRVRDTLMADTRLPLYDLWFVGEPELAPLSDLVYRSTMALQATRANRSTGTARTPIRSVVGQAGRGAMGFQEFPRKKYRPEFEVEVGDNFFSAYTLSLSELVGSDREKIRGLRTTAMLLLPKNQPYCYWEAAYPTHVNTIAFDVNRFAQAESLEFLSMPLTLRTVPTERGWTPSRPLASGPMQIDGWMLPGHGVVLLWKPASSQ
jgi:hypothetical protein